MFQTSKLWTEKYRPDKIEEYVWRDSAQKSQVEQWIKDKNIPHILLSGSQGLGKTSLINVLLNEIGIDKGDVLSINASEAVDVDMVRSKILNFASTMAFDKFKIIILEEADGLARSSASMPALKRIMEEYSVNCRFILTTNEPHKILPAIHSRCQTIHMISLNRDEYRLRLATILQNEGIELNENTVELLDSYIEATYPDLRKSINVLQQNTINIIDLNEFGIPITHIRLQPPSSDSGSKTDVFIKMVELFKSGNITTAREYVCEHADYNDYPEIYKFLYRNLNLFGDNEQQREDALLIVRDGLVKDNFCADREINLAACLVQLRQIKNSK